MNAQAQPPVTLPAELADVPNLLEDLDEFFEREYNGLEGSSGLTGYEKDEEFETPEDLDAAQFELTELRRLIGYRERISKLRTALSRSD
jgi:hypothetical protein